MRYKVVPFIASVSSKEGAQTAAGQLEELINQMSSEGWEYVRLESVDTYIAGGGGCFGIGATPATSTSFSMAVFRK